MILRKNVIVPVLVLFILFTAMFVSLVSIYEMPERMMGSKGTYVLTSSTDKNPIRSNLDIRIAYGLQNMSYITAVSPEIFVFTTLKGQAITVRGVLFKDFMSIEHGKIISGTLPNSSAEAMVGYRVAESMGLKVGENLTLIGSFKAAIAIVKITGIFKTEDPADDEILVSLSTARALAGIAPGKVSIIRVRTNNVEKVDKLMSSTYPKFTVSVNTTTQVYLGQKMLVNITVKNMGSDPGWANVTLTMGELSWTDNIYVRHERTVYVPLYPRHTGNFKLVSTVKNDIFYYTCYTQISVVKKPASIQGTTMVYTGHPIKYLVTSVNNTPAKEGNITVHGPDRYLSIYKVNNGTVYITFPYPGKYRLNYSAKYYTNSSLNVSAYKLTNLSSLANINPTPINNTIYAEENSWIQVYSQGTVHYSMDNGPLINATVIPVPKEIGENHTLSIFVIYGNYMANATYTLHPISSSKPKILAPVKNGSAVNYNETLTFSVNDPAPIKQVRYAINRVWKTIYVNQSFKPTWKNYTYNFTVKVKSPRFEIQISAEDVWLRTVYFNAQCKVLIDKDIIKPRIFVPPTVKIWSGNRTEVKATDNVELSLLSVHVFGRYFNSTSGFVLVKTSFYESGSIVFIPEGNYTAKVMAEDSAGNLNYTNFTIIINNTGEKNPPIITGPAYVNISAAPVTFHAFDNVNVSNIACYNGTTLIKKINGTALTLYPDDFKNGSYHLYIIATDVNGNKGYKYITLIKNYTDTIPPYVELTPAKIWSGNVTWVLGYDNIMMKKITVNAFGHTFTGISRVPIKTEFIDNGVATFVAPGTYIVEITAEDISGNIAHYNLTLEINNTDEKNPPVFTLPEFAEYRATDTITLRSFDNAGIKKMWVVLNGKTIAESNGEWLNFSATLLPCSYSKISVFAEDINGNFAWKNMTVYVKDNIKPYLITTYEKIWSGNSTTIIAGDNVRVKTINITLFGKFFESQNGTLIIPTKYIYNNSVHYISPGKYTGTVHIMDSSGNENSSVFTLIIDNQGEKIPPIIIGPKVGAINTTTSVTYTSFDNVKVKKMWVRWNSKTIITSPEHEIVLKYGILPAGRQEITVFAEDVNGNIAHMNSTVVVKAIKNVIMNASLENTNITVTERTTVAITLVNQDAPNVYNLTIYVDKQEYYTSSISLAPYEKKIVYVMLPYLDKGTHTIKVNSVVLTLKVHENPAAKLPTDLILKYAKDLKFTESKSVIYKGFQISEGNFLLVLASLFIITLILVFLGLYSTAMKGIKNNNIGVLRAIGASNLQIFKFFAKESALYFLIPGLVGIVGGYALVLGINKMNMLTAFGHHLTIVPTWRDIAFIIVLTFAFISASVFIIYRHLMKSRVVHIMGRESNSREVPLSELLRENS
ncbi:MAG: ABC transporter permease [Euryarchaeota archaeon]|nr:ABC transporter permease [Euryarchaeota archaeon]